MEQRTWFKGSFGGFAPIWVSEPCGDCFVHPRGLLGHILMPIAEAFTAMSGYDFLIGYDDSKPFQKRLTRLFDAEGSR